MAPVRTKTQSEYELARAQAILDSLSEGVLSLDGNWCFNYINSAAEEMMGRAAKDLLGKNLWTAYPHNVGTELEIAYRRAVETRIPQELEYFAPTVGRTFAIKAYPTNPDGLFITFHDVTDERLFGEASQHLAAIVESSDDGIISKDLRGVIQSWNAGAQRIFGYTAEEAIGRPGALLIPELHHNEEPGILRRIQSGERIDHYETIRRRKDGTLIQVSLTVSPIKNAAGQVIGASKIVRDLTAATEADEMRRRLAAIVESSDDAIISKNLQGVIQSWNAAAERMFGYTAEEIVGKPITTLIPADRQHEEPAILARLQRGERIEHFETIRQRKDGSSIHVSITVSPIKNAAGKIIGASKIARDISERRQAEAALRREHEALEELDRRKNEFLAMLGHELRNPLAALKNAAELLACDSGKESADWAMGVIDRQSRQLTRLVDDLLDVARVTRGQIVLRREAVDFAAIMKGAVDTARAFVDERGHTLHVSLPTEPQWIFADAARIEQLVINLLGNAAKYTDPGGRISVELARDGNDITARVADNGIGIAPDILPRVFDLFVQGSPGIDRAQGGLGIGLAVAKRLAEMHGGQLSAHSEGLGKGSAFTLRLPLLSQAPQPAASIPAADVSKTQTQPRKILVVDDNADGAQALARLLRRRGHEVHVAHDALQALDLARDFPVDIFLLDLGLPQMDGYELVQRLRANETRSAIYVAVSGYAQPHDIARSREAGFHRHLPKPVEVGDLLELLARADPSPRNE